MKSTYSLYINTIMVNRRYKIKITGTLSLGNAVMDREFETLTITCVCFQKPRASILVSNLPSSLWLTQEFKTCPNSVKLVSSGEIEADSQNFFLKLVFLKRIYVV